MSISTRTGDDGTTGLMYNRRVPKTHPRIEACGAVDELNAALGMARSLARDPWLNGEIFTTQKELVLIMGELATELPDFDRYVKDGFDLFQPQMTARLDGIVKDLEAQKISFQGWATPAPPAVAPNAACAHCAMRTDCATTTRSFISTAFPTRCGCSRVGRKPALTPRRGRTKIEFFTRASRQRSLNHARRQANSFQGLRCFL